MTLPTTRQQVADLVETLSARERMSFAAKLVVQHRETNLTQLRALIATLIETSNVLPRTVPVQADTANTTDAIDTDWDVLASASSIELTTPQTDACLNLHTRGVGIYMAVALKDEELLERILQQPSQSFKEKVRDTLSAIRRQKQKLEDAATSKPKNEPEIAMAKFAAFFDSIKTAASHRLPNDYATRTRTQAWEEYSKKSWDLPWENGSLTSVSDKQLRKSIADAMLERFTESPPVTITKATNPDRDVHVPIMTKLITRNLKELFKLCPQATIVAICTLITPHTKSIETNLLGPIFKERLNLWSRHGDGEFLVELIKPVLEKLDTTLDGNVIPTATLGVILSAQPVKAVVLFLLQKCLFQTKLIVDKYISQCDIFHNDPVRLRLLTDDYIRDIQSGCASTLLIIGNLSERALAISKIEAKLEWQRAHEKDAMKAVDDLLSVFGAAMDALPGHTETLMKQFVEKKDNYKRDWIVRPLFDLFSAHPLFANHMYEATSSDFRLEMYKPLTKTVLRHLAPTNTTVFAFPEHDTVAPYSGIQRDPAWSANAFAYFYALFPPVESSVYWVSIAPYLTHENLNLLKAAFDIADLVKLPAPHLMTVLDKLFVNVRERCEMAWKLMDAVKELRADLLSSQIYEYMFMLRQRLDVRVPEAREFLEKNVKQSTIEMRAHAITYLLASTNLAESVDETMATLTMLLPRLKNEMRPNMDQIFRVFQSKVNATFYEGYTIEQAKSLAAVYEAVDEHNLAAVSISPFAKQFVRDLATKMLGFYIGTPNHPFFEFALNVFWRHEVQIRGSSSSIQISFPFKDPDNTQRQEYLEFDRRKAYARGIELHKELDINIDLEYNKVGMFGLFRIPEGKEESVVAHTVEHVRLKYDAIIPKKTAFLDSNCGRTLLADLQKNLGLRWSKSNTLVTYYESCLAALENAPLLNDGAEPILNWAEFQNSGVLNFVTQCVQFSPNSEGTRWMNLRLKSNLAAEIARDLFVGCKTAVEKDALVIRLFGFSSSGSALHIPGILKHVILRLPRLLKAEHISERRVFWGLFHPGDMDAESNNSPDLLKFSVSNLSENPLPKNVLLKWQEELMVERYWAEALDATLPMNERVLSATRMMHMRCFSINKAATFLVTDSLPSRVKEAVLMFLPKLDEPACAVNLLLAPAYLQSDLARTAIYAVQNVLRYFKDDEVTRIFENLVPQEGQVGGVKVGVFKEILRLLGQYCHIPRILALFESLWERKKLNQDVRIAHLQQTLTLLKSNEPVVADAAWKLVLDAVHGKWFLDVSAVLVMVRVEGSVHQQMTEMTTSAMSYAFYRFGTITARPLPRNLASRYASDVIAPTALRLYNRMKTMSKNDKNYVDLTARTIYAFSILYHKFFIDEHNAGIFSQLFAGVSEEAAIASPDDVIATGVFKWIMPILGICTGLLAAANPTVIPHSWEQFSKCTRLIAQTILNANSTPNERSVAVGKLDSLALGTSYFPKAHTEDHALLQAAMLPIEQMETVRGGAKFFAALRLARETAWLKKNVIVFVRASQPIEERKFLIDLAEKIIITMLRFGFEKREYGVLDLTGKEYDDKFKELCQICEPLIGFHNRMKEIYESDSWCSDLVGFNAYRSQFRFALLHSALNLKGATSVSKYAEMLVKTDDPLLDEIHGQLATMIVQYLRECQESLRALNEWNKAPSFQTKPRHDQSGQNALISLMTELYRRVDSKPELRISAGFKLLESIVTACTVFLLEQLPGLTAQFIRNFATSAMEDTWFLHLEQAFTKREMTVLENADTGIEAIRLSIKRIVSGAQATGFDAANESKEMVRFSEVFRRTPAIMLHIAPEVTAYVAQHPTGAVGDAVLNLIKSLYRTETVSMYLQVVFDGRVGEVDLAKLVSLEHVREEESKFFELRAEIAGSSFNLSASNTRSRSSLMSVGQVAQRFVDHQMNGSPAFERYLNAAPNQNLIVSELSFVNSIPRLSHGGCKILNERVEVIKFIRRHMTAEVAVLNAYLYFECMISSLSIERVRPFNSPSMMEVIHIQSLISIDISLTNPNGFVRMAVPIRYILDIASALVFKIAPYYDEQGKHRIANGVRHKAMAMLQAIQKCTSNSCFARKSRKAVTAIDLLVLEAAQPGDVEGEMVVVEYQELVKALLLMGDRKLYDASCELQNSPWQLKWTNAELKDE
ncbi:hypothetical protein HDU80_006101 [Chytriomyces hyalinus]|nr:hypothetical protein HDU80_006101 [Chytriomyces hyalinus]